MSFNKKRIFIAVATALILSLSGCTESSGNVESNSATQASTQAENKTTQTDSSPIETSDVFSKRDKDSSYDTSTAVEITLADNNITCSSKSVSVKDDTVTITDEGTYLITGTLTNGRIVVDAKDTDKIQVVLNGVNINCDTSAPLYVKQADKVFVTLAEKSENTLSNKNEFVAIDDNNIDSVVFSKDDITFNGSGKLTVNASYGHGIVSKDDLVFTEGEYVVNAQNHALTANDSMKIANAVFTLDSGKDGLHAENKEDVENGIVYVESGTLNITSDGDGIDASATVDILNGAINITSGGGSENAEKKQEEMFGRGGFNPNANNTTTTTNTETTSAKGIKSTGDMNINGGTLNINSADDTLHSNSNLTISGGTITLSTGDDGIHANANTAISSGTINITDSYEGIEGQTIEISGGDITLVASDDGLNAAGGNDESGFGGGMRPDEFMAGENSYIKISDGMLKVDASGDGVDSNGALYISGGETYVMGPTNSGNGTLDYGSTAEITGGIFVGAGASGMAQNFSSSSTQGAMLVNTSMAGSTGDIILKDSNGNEIISYTPSRSYNSVIVSCPEIESGKTYTLTANNTDTTVEMTSLIYGSSNGMGGIGGKGGNRMGGNPMGGMQPSSDMMR